MNLFLLEDLELKTGRQATYHDPSVVNIKPANPTSKDLLTRPAGKTDISKLQLEETETHNTTTQVVEAQINISGE